MKDFQSSLIFLLFLFVSKLIFAEEKINLYQEDGSIKKLLQELPVKTLVRLPATKIVPEDAAKLHSGYKNGPGRRDFCNKIAYAPDRETGMYAGANHNSPHRLTDAWEFHLLSNTWHLLCKPGLDGTRKNYIDKELKKNPDNEELKKRKNAWYEGVVFENGYLQDKATGGSIAPWHTWDGLTYDYEEKILLWNVLEADNHDIERLQKQPNYIKNYAKRMNLDAEKMLSELKPGSGVFLFSTKTNRWVRQMGEGPFPRSLAMGGTMHYIPSIKKSISYICAGNRPGGYVEGMWAYDAKLNKWEVLIEGNKVSGLMKNNQAPGEELQVAYSGKHNKLVAVQKNSCYVYDVEKNNWSKAADMEAFGHDALSVFVYDDKADLFLLLSRKGTSHFTHEPWQIYSFDLNTNKWEVNKVEGIELVDDTKRQGWLKYNFAGYYDQKENAFVLYEGRKGDMYVYRHSK